MNTEKFLQTFKADYIQSRSNQKTVDLAKLTEKKFRDRSGLFLAEGVKLAEEALRWTGTEVDCVIIAESAAGKTESENDRIFQIAKTANELNVRLCVFADSAFEKISTESAPQGVIAVVNYCRKLHTAENFSAWQQNRRLLMLEEIRDPGNLGTILRSAEAMGITGVILSGCADLYSPKVVRAAMGTLFRMPVYITSDGMNCIQLMKQSGRRVLAAALGEHTLTLGKYPVQDTDCPIIGNEGHGISEDKIAACTACVRIPMSGRTESLNASAAAACILWEYFRAEQTTEL